jgi:hypothetical protein
MRRDSFDSSTRVARRSFGPRDELLHVRQRLVDGDGLDQRERDWVELAAQAHQGGFMGFHLARGHLRHEHMFEHSSACDDHQQIFGANGKENS